MVVTYIRLKRSISSEEDDGPDQLGVEQLSVERLGDIGKIDLVWELVTNGKSDISLVIHVLRIESVRVVVLAVGHASVKMIYSRSGVSINARDWLLTITDRTFSSGLSRLSLSKV